MHVNMKNIAYTKEYLDWREDAYRHLFTQKNYKGEERKELGNGFSMLSKDYYYNGNENNDPAYPYSYNGSENTVYCNNTNVYSFKTINDQSRCRMFTHKNGHEHLFFKSALYGYSILDLTTRQDYQYFPAASFPAGETETFIWCEVFYNPINSMAAVEGCYWACPYGVMLADFSEPLSDCRQLELYDCLEKDFYYNCGFDFIKWDGTDLILKSAGEDEPQQDAFKIITSDEYMAWFDKGEKGE